LRFDAYKTMPRGTQQAFESWLDLWKFTHFISLAINDPMLSAEGARQLLKEWDARMNRALLGPKWANRPDERMFNFYFLEKPNTNPHWHGLIMLGGFDDETLAHRAKILTEKAEPIWKAIKPSGTVKVKPIYHQQGASNYIAKELGYEVSYANFVTPDEF
jgi:hypothetical protein